MSFFDRGDEPTRASARPPRSRRPAGGATRAGGPAAGGPDRQTILLRQAMLLGVGLLVVVLLVFGVKSCRDSQRERSLKDYNRDVTAVITDSDRDVGRPLFQLLGNGARQGGDLQVQVNQLRLAADEDARRARDFDVPGEMRSAQDNLLLVLNLRAGALRKIAADLAPALGRGQPSEQAIGRIAGQMQAFLASDVVYDLRVAPLIKQTLDERGIGGQTIIDSRFLPSLEWLSPSTVASRLGRSAGDGGTAVAPGLHGHGLDSVAVGDTTLQTAPAINRVPAAGVTFTVRFANQGDHDEGDVRVEIRARGGGRTIQARRTVAQTKAKSPAEVRIPLGQAPPIGSTVVDVVVAAVPGEEKTDNNRQRYTVIFTR